MRTMLAHKPYHTIRYEYASGNILQNVWGEIVASAIKPCSAIELFDSSGRALSLSLGAAGVEDNFVFPYTITPNGSTILLPIEIPRESRISVKPLDGDAVDGQIIINFFG